MLLRPYVVIAVTFFSVIGCVDGDDGKAAAETNDSLEITADGSAAPACSPVDGPAVAMTFATGDGRQIRVNLNTSLDQAEGAWKLGGGYASGGLSISLCNAEGPCSQAHEGKLVIDQANDVSIKGELSVTFDEARIEAHRFILSVSTTKQPQCG